MLKKLSVAGVIREKIVNESFISNHKAKFNDFTRNRKLTFQSVFMQIFRKTLKSLQLSLNEIFMSGDIPSLVSPSAYTQARNKFKHTAFIELNNDIISIFYSEEESIKKWNGYRCIGVDGSKIILPKSTDVIKEFGSIAIKGNDIDSFYSSAMFECYYDVLNHIAINSMLAHGLSYEVDLATQMLGAINERDLLIYDRAYASYEFLATLTQRNKNYLIRCPYSSFTEVQLLLDKVKCETLVLVGEEDWIMAKEHSELIANKISGSKLLIFPRADHCLELDTPEAFFGSIREFISPEFIVV